MVTCIIYQDDCVTSPSAIDLVQMFTELDNEQQEGITIVLTFVYSIVELTMVADSSNDTKLTRPLR